MRTTELIGAHWDEIDLAAAEWRIPGSRMKMKTPHIVPLAPQTVEVLHALQTAHIERKSLSSDTTMRRTCPSGDG